jgi:hypothetical protein
MQAERGGLEAIVGKLRSAPQAVKGFCSESSHDLGDSLPAGRRDPALFLNERAFGNQ